MGKRSRETFRGKAFFLVLAYILCAPHAWAATCGGYPLQTFGKGPAGYVCRCTYGPGGKADWWAVIPGAGAAGAIIACEGPEGSDANDSTASTDSSEDSDGESANHCLSVETGTNSLADFWVNDCEERVSVKWFDAGHCSRGCGDYIDGHDRSTKVKQEGRFSFAACFAPAYARDYDAPDDDFSCR